MPLTRYTVRLRHLSRDGWPAGSSSQEMTAATPGAAVDAAVARQRSLIRDPQVRAVRTFEVLGVVAIGVVECEACRLGLAAPAPYPAHAPGCPDAPVYDDDELDLYEHGLRARSE